MRIIFKIFASIILIISFTESLSAIEPSNNLNKSLEQIQREFPDCIYWCDSGRGKYYKSVEDDIPIMFEIKNGKVICEFMLIEGNAGFARDWFIATVNAFSKSDYQHVLPSDGNNYHFIYSYFTVYISYDDYQNNASITYELLPRYMN